MGKGEILPSTAEIEMCWKKGILALFLAENAPWGLINSFLFRT